MIYLLLVVFQLKHLVMDFFCQNAYMLGKFDKSWRFFFPMLAHSGVNAAGTLIICLAVNPALWWLGFVDLVSHFLIDRLKAGPRYFGQFHALSASEMQDNIALLKIEAETQKFRYTPDIKRAIKHNRYFWLALGLDQTMHQIVYIVIIAFLMGAI